MMTLVDMIRQIYGYHKTNGPRWEDGKLYHFYYFRAPLI